MTYETYKDLNRRLDELGLRIKTVPSAKRYEFQPQLQRLILSVEAAGHRVSPRIHDLNRSLIDDAIEAQFDNMPV